MAVEFPFVATSMEPFGGPVPETDAADTSDVADGMPGGVGTWGVHEATPAVAVSIATTKDTAPKIRRNWDAWRPTDMPDDNLNQPF